MFESWGYTAADSEWMMAEYERQAREKYISGDYQLGVLNMHGQRVSLHTLFIANPTLHSFMNTISGVFVFLNSYFDAIHFFHVTFLHMVCSV